MHYHYCLYYLLHQAAAKLYRLLTALQHLIEREWGWKPRIQTVHPSASCVSSFRDANASDRPVFPLGSGVLWEWTSSGMRSTSLGLGVHLFICLLERDNSADSM